MESASLDFEAGSIREKNDNVSTQIRGTLEIRLLKNVTLFGANSSGKTNFLKGFSLMRFWLLNSLRESAEGRMIPLQPFRLNTATEKAPTSFEVEFLIGKTGYRYGYKADSEKIFEEWLFITTRRKEENVFIRVLSDYQIDRRFQGELKQKMKVLVELTKSQVLFLTVMAQFNIIFAQEIVSWFTSHRIFIDDRLDYKTNTTASLLKDERYRNIIYDIIKRCDLGFTTIQEELEERIRKPSSNIYAFNAIIENELQAFTIKTRHAIYDRNQKFVGYTYFDLNAEESSGARKFIALLGPVVQALVDGQIIWIDELDSRLHTFLVTLIVQLFNSAYNQSGCQAIITTHNIQVFRKLRRDQMFLLEKNEFGMSAMSSVYDAHPHIRGDAAIDKEYLNRRLRGVPNTQILIDFDPPEEA